MNCIGQISRKFDISFENEFTRFTFKTCLKFTVLFWKKWFIGIKTSNTCVQLNNLTDIHVFRIEFHYIL